MNKTSTIVIPGQFSITFYAADDEYFTFEEFSQKISLKLNLSNKQKSTNDGFPPCLTFYFQAHLSLEKMDNLNQTNATALYLVFGRKQILLPLCESAHLSVCVCCWKREDKTEIRLEENKTKTKTPLSGSMFRVSKDTKKALQWDQNKKKSNWC